MKALVVSVVVIPWLILCHTADQREILRAQTVQADLDDMTHRDVLKDGGIYHIGPSRARERVRHSRQDLNTMVGSEGHVHLASSRLAKSKSIGCGGNGRDLRSGGIVY